MPTTESALLVLDVNGDLGEAVARIRDLLPDGVRCDIEASSLHPAVTISVRAAEPGTCVRILTSTVPYLDPEIFNSDGTSAPLTTITTGGETDGLEIGTLVWRVGEPVVRRIVHHRVAPGSMVPVGTEERHFDTARIGRLMTLLADGGTVSLESCEARLLNGHLQIRRKDGKEWLDASDPRDAARVVADIMAGEMSPCKAWLVHKRDDGPTVIQA